MELKAKELYGWEDFLFARCRFLGTDAGLETMNAHNSVKVVGDRLLVSDLSGLTAAGQPVRLTNKDSGLEIPIASHNIVDLFIALIDPETEADNRASRLSLVMEDVLNVDVKSPEWDTHRHDLYLGRWRVQGKLLMVKRPLVRRLDALRGFDGWEEWTAPLWKALRNLLNKEARFADKSSTMASVRCFFVADLGLRWWRLPISELVVRLQNIQRFLQLASAIGDEFFQPIDGSNGYRDLIAEDIVEYLRHQIGAIPDTSAVGEMQQGLAYTEEYSSGQTRLNFLTEERPVLITVNSVLATDHKPPVLNIRKGAFREEFRKSSEVTWEMDCKSIPGYLREDTEWFILHIKRKPEKGEIRLLRVEGREQ